MVRDDLKRCPFCGAKAFMWSWNGGTAIQCDNYQNKSKGKDGHLVQVEADTQEEAIKLWNTRTEGNYGKKEI